MDLFISHASEDADAVARPLAMRLRGNGWSVWFDEFELSLGDPLRERIDDGLANARFGVVILSPSFFAKRWTRRELDGLTARELGGSNAKVILPIWHEVDHAYVERFSPPLADRLAIRSAAGLDAIVEQIERVLRKEGAGPNPRDRSARVAEIPSDQLSQIRALAERDGITVREALRRAIANHDYLAALEAAKSQIPLNQEDVAYDKYGSVNPFVKGLMRGFEARLTDLMDLASPSSLIDVGCGEGILTHSWAQDRPDRTVVGVDLDDPVLQGLWEQRTAPNLTYRVISAGGLPGNTGEFDTATAIEVLEHVPDPKQLLAEMARVATGHLLVSVPREPLWRATNVARGAYLRDLGNTPGHINHWSKRAFIRLLSEYGDVVRIHSPFPWTMLLVQL